MCSIDTDKTLSRQDFLKIGGAGIAGAAMLGTLGSGGSALAEVKTPLKAEIKAAAARYEVPKELLLAMSHVNTLWEMPPPGVSDYEPGDLHGRGEYGIMQLAQNPSRDTLGKAASLTGFSEKKLKNNRSANIQGGAALLSSLQSRKTKDLGDWQEAVAEYGSTELYATEVYKALESGGSRTISTGERITLSSQEVEVPVVFEAQRRRRTDYPHAGWRPAHYSNYSKSGRERSYNINRVIIHVGEGSHSSIVGWFQNPAANVSAHYVVNRRGAASQCVRHKNIAWHAGNWWYNSHSIGIEHAGYGANRGTWTRAMYRASARITAYTCRRHNIPVTTRHILTHRRVSATRCPGKHFNYRRYMRLVRRYM